MRFNVRELLVLAGNVAPVRENLVVMNEFEKGRAEFVRMFVAVAVLGVVFAVLALL